jgi:hypothetical protein
MFVISPVDLPRQLQRLLDNRQRHIESIARIDQTMAGVLAVLDGSATAPAAMMAIERANTTGTADTSAPASGSI